MAILICGRYSIDKSNLFWKCRLQIGGHLDPVLLHKQGKHWTRKMQPFWRNFHRWLHWKLSKWQLPVQPVMKISSKWHSASMNNKHHVIHRTQPELLVKQEQYEGGTSWRKNTSLVQHVTTQTVYTQYWIIRVWLLFVNVVSWSTMTSSNGKRYWPFVRGIHRSPVNSPHKGQWRGALMFSWICAWINAGVNNGEAGDLRHHRAHYDVIVMDDSESLTTLHIGVCWRMHVCVVVSVIIGSDNGLVPVLRWAIISVNQLTFCHLNK